MYGVSQIILSRLLLAGLCAPLVIQAALAQTSVRTVKVLGGKDTVEIEVEASDRIVPQTQILTGPDRLVIDFPNAVPGNQLRSQSVDQGEVKDVRIGLFQAKPPVTRLVLDLRTAQSYQVFPSGRTVIIKVMGGATDASARVENLPSEPSKRPGLVVASYVTRVDAPRIVPAAQPALEVTYRNGLLGIRANKATLSEVLYAVQQRTGAEVSIAAGAEQESVVAEIAPGAAPEVLARLLNGSRFNFLILSAVDDPGRLDRVILSARPDGSGYMAPPLAPLDSDNNNPGEEPVSMNVPPTDSAPAQGEVRPQPEGKNPSDETTPDQ
jgi:antitoxin (DNA-binding transcriptional repressor) of toxin-antitoxin stability system